MPSGRALAHETPSAEDAVTARQAPVTVADAPEPQPLEVEMGKVHDDEGPLTVASVEADFG